MQQGFEFGSCSELHSTRITSPTCEDLGIPRGECDGPTIPVFQNHQIRNPSLFIDGIRYETCITKGLKSDPFSPLCMIPLPVAFGIDAIEPAFVRKRNERERERVKCVNDGYARLKEHLPLPNKDKRISKVETLRRAIDYIRHLESLLSDCDSDSCKGDTTDSECGTDIGSEDSGYVCNSDRPLRSETKQKQESVHRVFESND